jgi:hypothetical protein
MTELIGECLLWGGSAKIADVAGDYSIIDSDRAGGKYKVSRSVNAQLKLLSAKERTIVTNWLVQQRELGEQCPYLNSYSLVEALATRLFSPPEQLDRSLLWIVDNLGGLGRTIALGFNPPNVSNLTEILANTNRFSAYIGCSDHIEAMEILNFGVKAQLLDAQNHDIGNFGRYSITLNGYNKYEELTKSTSNSELAFVAMWFNDSMDDVYSNGIAAGIRKAGYEPVRIDNKEHNNKIDDEIISEIRRAKFLVADFTSEVLRKDSMTGLEGDRVIARGGVYFEAGFAKGLGKEVIWTVREDVLPFVHFDTRQFAHIVWRDSADLCAKLEKRISATLGDGPLKK